MNSYFIGNSLIPYEEIGVTTMQECISYLKDQSVIGLDIETMRAYPKGTYDERVYKAGLDPYLSKICMVQVGTLDKRFMIDARVVDVSPLKEVLEDESKTIVGHNLKFEGKFFLHHHGIRLNNVWDTMICEQIFYNGLKISYSLEALMYRYLGIKPVQDIDLFSGIENLEREITNRKDEYFILGIQRSEEEIEAEVEEELLNKMYIDKSIRMGFVEIGDRPFTIEQLEYGEQDIIAPLKIKEEQLKGRYVDSELYLPSRAFKLENKFTQVLADIELQGTTFSKQKWIEVYELALQAYKLRLNALNSYIEKTYLEFCTSIDLFTATPTCAVKWSSSKEVIRLFKHLKIAPKERSKTTRKLSYTVGAKALFKSLTPEQKGDFFNNRFPEIKSPQDLMLAYLLYKKSEQACTTFGKDWLKYVHPITYRVHSNYRQYLHTGRLSSVNPNLQNIPTGGYRDCFNTEKGWDNINADFSGQELRILAFVSNNKTLIEFFSVGHPTFGRDLHSFAGTNIFRNLYKDDTFIVSKNTPKERGIAKNFNFKINYGGSAFTLSQELAMPVEEVETLLKHYFDGFPGLKQDFDTTQKLAYQRGWIQLDPYTNKRYFFPYKEKMDSLQNKAWSFYPDNYRELSKEEQQKVKSKINANNPELKKTWSEYFYLKGKIERKGLNYRIQGNAATMMKLALILVYNWRVENDLTKECYIDNVVHDEMNGKSLKNYSKQFAEVISRSMVKSGTYTCPVVPMEAEAVISEKWEH